MPTPKSIFLPKKGVALLSTSFSQRLAQTTQAHLSLMASNVWLLRTTRENEFKQIQANMALGLPKADNELLPT